MKTIRRILALWLLSLLSLSSFATDYVFTGNGLWSNPANWAGGLLPSGYLQAGNTITITGTAVIDNTFSPYNLGGNYGTITIATGGSLSLQNATQFSLMGGTIIVNGTLTNNTTFNIYPNTTINVNGTVINQRTMENQGTVTINNGGVYDNQLSAQFVSSPPWNPTANSGVLILNSGGTILNQNTAKLNPGNLINNGGTINNYARLMGSPVVTGNLTNAGILAPGNSPGVYTVTGDYTATSGAVHEFEIGGTASANYDRLVVSGTVNLGGTLNATLINGFNPASIHDITLITGTINGTFATVNKPAKYMVVYTSNSVVLRYNAVLPVSFTKLDVKKEGSAARISWNIQNEVNVSRYVIERGINGTDFRPIGEVVARQDNHYSFLDSKPEAESYYRIKSVDKDGGFRYSMIVNYKAGITWLSLQASPNPVKGVLSIQHATSTARSRISIFSVDGRMVQVVYPAEDVQKTTLDVSAFKAGTYILSYEDGKGKVEKLKFVKK